LYARISWITYFAKLLLKIGSAGSPSRHFVLNTTLKIPLTINRKWCMQVIQLIRLNTKPGALNRAKSLIMRKTLLK